jgi:hypothetical protein
MADDDRRSETFIREVDEELRRDQLKALWKRFAPLIIGVCVLVVAITAGYRGWIWWHERQAAQAGDRFLAAIEQIQSGKTAEGEAALQAIAAESGAGYASLARLRLAGEKAGEGKKDEALKDFDAIANDNAVSTPLRDIARIRAALLALDTGDLEGAKTRATPLIESGNPWRHMAREVVGTADYQEGDLKAARAAFQEIQEDAQTPPDLWLRSGLMIALIDGQLPEATTSPPADSSAAPAEGEQPAAPSAGEQSATPSAPEPTATQQPSDGGLPATLPLGDEMPSTLPLEGEGQAGQPNPNP